MKQVHFGHTTSDLTGSGSIGYFSLNLQSVHAQEFFQVRWPVRAAGTLRNLRLLLEFPPGTGNSWTFRLYKNGSATAIAVTISGSSVQGEDTVNSVAVAVGDYLGYQTTRTGSATLCECSTAIEFDSSIPKECFYAQGPSQIPATRYLSVLSGPGGAQTTFDSVFQILPLAGAVTQFYCELQQIADGLPAPPGVGNSKSFVIYKNGVAQDGTGGTPNTRVTIVDTATSGLALVTLNLVTGDVVWIEATVSGTPVNSNVIVGVKFVSAIEDQFPICGVLPNWNTTESYTYATATANETENGVESQVEMTGSVTTLRITGFIGVLAVAPGDPDDDRIFQVRVNGEDAEPEMVFVGSQTESDGPGSFLLNNTDVWSLRLILSASALDSDVAYSFYGTSDLTEAVDGVIGPLVWVHMPRLIP